MAGALRSRVRRPARRTAVRILAVAVLLGVPVWVQSFRLFRDSTHGTELQVPGTTRVHLDDGRWLVFEKTGASRSYGPVSVTEYDGPAISPAGVAIEGAGDSTTPRPLGHGETITWGSSIFVAVAQFEVAEEGDYDVTVNAARQADAMLARPLSDSIFRVAPWLVLATILGLTTLFGIVFVIVPRRDGAPGTTPAVAPMPMAVPPGWYPDPVGGTGLRWWDGSTWTDHVHQQD